MRKKGSEENGEWVCTVCVMVKRPLNRLAKEEE